MEKVKDRCFELSANGWAVAGWPKPWVSVTQGPSLRCPLGGGASREEATMADGEGSSIFHLDGKSQHLGTGCEVCGSSEKADHGGTRPGVLTGWGSLGPGQERHCLWTPQVLLPLLPRPPRAPGDQETQWCRSIQGTNTAPCREGCGGPLTRAEQGTEIKRGRGWEPETPPWRGSSGSSCLGLQDRWGQAQGLGHAREGREGPPGPEAEGTSIMQSSLVTCVSEKGGPSRCMHACDREGTMEELGRWPGATPPSVRMVAGAPSHSTALKGHREYEQSTQSLAQKGATFSAGAGAGRAKPAAAPQA